MREEQNNPKAPWWQPGLVLFGRLSGWIAGPVIIAVFLGKWLDQRYGTEPWLFLIAVGVAFLLSSFGIVRDSIKEIKRIEEESKKKDKIPNNK